MSKTVGSSKSLQLIAVQAAVDESLEKKGKDSQVVVFPQGSITLPLYLDDSQILI